MAANNDLLDAVLEHPEDVELCQVYADSLTEDLDQRGEFIAEQIRLGELSEFDDEYPALVARTNRLQHKYVETWLAEFLKPSRETERSYSRLNVNACRNAVFKNGFLHRIAIHVDEVDSLWPRLTATEPVRAAELLVDESIPDECRTLKPPASWTELKVSPDQWFTSYSVAVVLAWGLSNILDLDLSGCDLSGDGVAMLTTQEPLSIDIFDHTVVIPPLPRQQLTALRLKNTQLFDEGLQLLTQAEFPSLNALDVSQCRLTDEASLQAIMNLQSLTELDLSGNSFAIDSLASWSGLKRLCKLSLPKETTADSFEKLFPNPSVQLSALDLTAAKDVLTNSALVGATAERFAYLNLGTTRIGDAGLKTLLEFESIRTVLELKLNGCSLSDKAVTSLVESDCNRLVNLDLSSNKLTDKAMQQLAEWESLKHVTHFRIGNNRKLSADGFAALADSQFFQPTQLDIGKTKDEAITSMLEERFGDAVVSS